MATVEVNQMAFEQTFIAPNKHNQQVPNHLLDTKIFSKVAENDVFQASPSRIHFTGFELKKTSKQVL
ncbi:cilia- and flagella-associated 221-like, partial [Paramuricea clavata]